MFADAGGVNSLTEEDVKIPAGHKYGDLVPKQEPTCTQTGMQAHYKCSVCNEYFDESKIEKTVADLTIPIDPNAHDFGAWIAEVPATCVATGTKGHQDCNRCNRHYDENGNELTDLTIPTNDNHDWNAWASNLDGTHTRTCKRDSSHTENANCSGGKATCTTQAVCDFCRTTYGGTAPHNTTQYGGKDSSGHWDKCSTCDNKFNFEAHTPDREKADETNPIKCTKCGFEITPAGHYEHTADSEWHNSADGKYHYHECTQSGCSVILDKADHSGGTATCENKAVCSVCGVAYGDKLGHNYGEVKYTWTSDNTCKAERVCKHDNAHIESETVTATGTTITAATCKEKGKMKYTATFVNTSFTAQEKEVDIDFAKHTYGDLIPEVPATCIAGGMKAHYKCTVCGKFFDEDKNETTEEALTTPVSPYYGHNFGFWVEEEYATCQAPGRKGYKHCSICNKDYDASNTEITDFVIPINPDGHEVGDLVAEIPATCKDTGVKEHRDCNLCGKHCDPITRKEIADLTIPATGVHNYGDWVSNGDGTHTRTCTTGSHSETENCSGGTATCENKAVCSVCGAEYGEKLGHDYGEVKYTWTDNVCKAERVCKHDSTHIESETVTATGTTITAATCKEKGKMKYTATFENTAFTKQEKEVDIDFAPHTFGAWKDEIPATTEDFGTKGHKDCTVCGRHFDKDGGEITELRIAKIGTHNVVINGESKFYTHGESVTVTAEDKEDKVFVGWQDESGEIVSAEKSYTFKVSGEKTLTAVYEDKSSGGGEITPPAKKDGLSGGQIAGIVIGAVLLAGIGGFAVLWFAVKKKNFADLGVALQKGFTAIGNFFKNLGAKIKALFTKKK